MTYRANLFTAGRNAGLVVLLALLGSLLSAGSAGAAAQDFSCAASLDGDSVEVSIDDNLGSVQWAVNLRRGSTYVFLGRHRSVDLRLPLPDGLELGDWKVQARGILADGTKANQRQLCGRITIDTPEPVNYRCVGFLDTDSYEIGVGDIVPIDGPQSEVVLLSNTSLDDTSVNFRSTDGWLGTAPLSTSTMTSVKDLDGVVSEAVVRPSGESHRIPCDLTLTDGLDIQSPEGFAVRGSFHTLIGDVSSGTLFWAVERQFPFSRDIFADYYLTDLETGVATPVTGVLGDTQFDGKGTRCDDTVLIVAVSDGDPALPSLGVIDLTDGSAHVSFVDVFGSVDVDCGARTASFLSDGIVSQVLSLD